MTKHTPGPWTLSRSDDETKCFMEVNAHSWGRFAEVVVRMEGDDSDHLEGLANANLIAAAPDLLEAATDLIKDIRSRYPGEELKCPFMIALDRACAKATS